MIVTGDVRRNQQANIDRLATLLPFARKIDASPVEDWPRAPWPILTDELVVAFELPECGRVGNWVDVRKHPLRFLDLWSVESNCITFPEVPLPSGIPCRDNGEALFACQVRGDAQLWDGSRFVTPEDYRDDIEAFAARFDVLWIAPHPLDPFAEYRWPRNARNCPHTYALMRRCSELLTISSSTAREAPLFGCRSNVLLRWPPEGKAVSTTELVGELRRHA